MTYFQRRRTEILGSRKRKPRRCDIRRQVSARYAAVSRAWHAAKRMRRLEIAWGRR